MFVYVILFVVLVLSWPAFSLLFDGLKFLYTRASGKRPSKRSGHSHSPAPMIDEEDEDLTISSSIDEMRILGDFRVDAGDDLRFH